MKTSKNRLWTWWEMIVIGLLLSTTIDLQMIYYRLRNIDTPKEVHIMVPGMNSNMTEISQ